MVPTMASAFQAASGFSPSHISTGVILIVAAVAYLWGAHAVKGMLSLVMYKPTELSKGAKYSIRVIVLLMLLTYLLT